MSVFHPNDAPGGGPQFAGETAHQRGLAGAVRPDDGDALAAFDVEGEIVEHFLVRPWIAETQLLDRYRRTIQLLALLEADVRVLPRRRPDLLDLDFFELLLARSRLARLGRVRGKAPHEFLQVGDPVLGFGVRGFDARPRLNRRQHEVVVVAGIDLQLLKIQIRHVGAHLIQEMPIVADDHHGGVVVVERAFQPADRIDVEIVGRFVQQQHVRSREQRLRQQHAQLEARGHFAHRSVVPRFVNAGIGEDAARPRLGIVAAVFGEHALELGRLHVVVVGRIRDRRRCGRAPSSPPTVRCGRA